MPASPMRRLAFYMLALFAAASLLLTLALVFGWVRSYHVYDTFGRATEWKPDPSGSGQSLEVRYVMHFDGRVTVMSFRDWTGASFPPYGQMPGWRYARSTTTPMQPSPPTFWSRLGFAVVRDDTC